MSLQVWLPLTGDIKNQGNTPCTISGTPAYGTGKIGQALDLINSAAITISCPALNNKSQFSVCFWIKGTKDTSDGDWASPIRFTANKSGGTANSDFRFGKDNRADQTGYPIAMFNNSNYPISTSNVGISTADDWDKWIHVCFTTNGTSIKTYVDGIYKYGSSAGTGGWLTGTITLRAARYNGFLNDFRVYDKVLSVEEIKDLARGLILHYPLDRNNWGQDNLIKGTYKLDGDTTVASAVTKTNNAFRGFTSATYDNTSGTSYHELISWNNKVTVSANEIYTTSFYAKSPVSTTLTCYFYNNTSGVVQVASSDASTGAHNTGTDGNITIQLTPDWTYYWITWTFNSTATSATKSLLFRCLAGKGELSVCGVKLEKGNKSSPWVPNSADALYSTLDIGNTIEYDTSGYQRNGTRSNTLTWDADSPKYGISTIFNGTNTYIAAGTGAKVRDAITVNCWGYMDNWSTYAARMLSCTEGGGWNFEPSSSKMSFAVGTGESSNTYKNVAATSTLASLGSGWHMFTGTYDGFSSKIYIDGVLSNTNSAYTTKTPLFYNASNGIFVGAEAGGNTTTPAGSYFNGKISDVRIYATALSAQDIQDLYNGLF